MGSYQREIKDVVEAIKKAHKLGYKVNLLTGAGCSISAGIPSANDFITKICRDFPYEYERCKHKTYGECMNKLTPTERRSLIAEYVNDAKVNWCHLCIAKLIKEGFVDRVLTTNFDNLLVRACAIVDYYPSIYDLTYINDGRSDFMFDKSIIYLHGQYNGLILCNTKEEVENQTKKISGIFKELNRKSVWIVVGYSGENDAISKLLANEEVNENRLYWIGYNKKMPCKFVEENILSED